MVLQQFSLEVVQKVRQHILAQLSLPPSEQHPATQDAQRRLTATTVEPTSLDALGDLFRLGGLGDEESPAPNLEGRWFISTLDPAAAITHLPGLSLKPGVRLVTYLQRRMTGGMGVTWALPERLCTTADLETALEGAGTGLPPHPKGALGHVMDGIAGDRSPGSYLAASLLLRELKEFGRSGAQLRWSHHQLIGGIPPEKPWQWRTQPPTNWLPKLKKKEDQTVLVEFFSCRLAPPVSIFRHLDQYGPKSYRPQAHDQAISLLPPD